MARQLRVLAAALTEDPGSILSIHTVIPVSEDPTLSSGLLRHCTYGMHIHTCRQNAHILFWGWGTLKQSMSIWLSRLQYTT